jgi:hypothetical protein
MNDAQDPGALFELLCNLHKDSNSIGEGEQQSPWTPPNLDGQLHVRSLVIDESESTFMKGLPLFLPAASAAPTKAKLDWDNVSSHSNVHSPEVALPATYQVWYEFHRLRYTIRICRSGPLSSSRSSSNWSLPSTARKRQSIVNIAERLANLEHFDALAEDKDMPNRIVDTNVLSEPTNAASKLPNSETAQLKMRRCLRGGWSIRSTNAEGQSRNFRACPDLTSFTAWRNRGYRWSEGATGKVIARSGHSSSPCSEKARCKPFMRFTCEDKNEQDKDSVTQQTQDDLLACWTAWLWADQVLPSVIAGCSMESSKFTIVSTHTSAKIMF